MSFAPRHCAMAQFEVSHSRNKTKLLSSRCASPCYVKDYWGRVGYHVDASAAPSALRRRGRAGAERFVARRHRAVRGARAHGRGRGGGARRSGEPSETAAALGAETRGGREVHRRAPRRVRPLRRRRVRRRSAELELWRRRRGGGGEGGGGRARGDVRGGSRRDSRRGGAGGGDGVFRTRGVLAEEPTRTHSAVASHAPARSPPPRPAIAPETLRLRSRLRSRLQGSRLRISPAVAPAVAPAPPAPPPPREAPPTIVMDVIMAAR